MCKLDFLLRLLAKFRRGSLSALFFHSANPPLSAPLVMQPSSGRASGRGWWHHLMRWGDISSRGWGMWFKAHRIYLLLLSWKWQRSAFIWCGFLWIICSLLSCYLRSNSVPAHMVHFQALFHSECCRIFNPKAWYPPLFLNTSHISLCCCHSHLLLIWLEHLQKKCLKHLQIMSEGEGLAPEVLLCMYS